MTEGEENIIIKGVLLEAISRDFSEELDCVSWEQSAS